MEELKEESKNDIDISGVHNDVIKRKNGSFKERKANPDAKKRQKLLIKDSENHSRKSYEIVSVQKSSEMSDNSSLVSLARNYINLQDEVKDLIQK